MWKDFIFNWNEYLAKRKNKIIGWPLYAIIIRKIRKLWGGNKQFKIYY